ncbi:MAG: nitrilase-related carbon-nitrogen hydrolase [Gemmataceae bacterium]
MAPRTFACLLLLGYATSRLVAGDHAKPFEGWVGASPREEIRPTFSFEEKRGAKQSGSLVIETDGEVGQHGWYRKVVPLVGGKTYRFLAMRQTQGVESPRRSTPVRIVWLDAKGSLVPFDGPGALRGEGRPVPTAEPEHPRDGVKDKDGWTSVSGVYRAPENATQAVIELHLQWAPNAKVWWSDIRFEETTPVAPRNVKLASIHHMPSGKSALANCEEFAPLVADAAKQGADLVVLGETVHYVGLRKKPHEVAEPADGPCVRYFCELAKKHCVHLVVSLYEREGRVVYNVALLISPEGRIIGKYRKVCLPHAEIERGVMPGNDYPVFETKFGKVGMMICYDGFFPEVARELTNRGAEVIAWPVWGCDPLLAKARANENRVFVVSSTYMSPKSGWMLSAIYGRDGSVLASGEKWGSVVVAEVDLNAHQVGPYNLGDFGAMVQRHRPIPVTEPAPRPSTKSRSLGAKLKMKTVAVLLFDGVELMDFAGPAEVFIVAAEGKAFRVVTVAESTKTLKTMGGITVTPDYDYTNAPKADIVVVPGGNMRSVSKDGIAWIKKASKDAEITMSVCFGAMLLADAGLLDEIEATTHHWGMDRLRKVAPKCKVVEGKRFVDAGKVITTAGVTAGIDGALRVVERLLGQEAAAWTADEWMEHRGQAPRGRPQ